MTLAAALALPDADDCLISISSHFSVQLNSISSVTLFAGTNAEITQLAATYGEKTFNRYVLPEGDITPDASRVTKLTKRDGHLYHDDEPVDTVDLTQCLTEFFAFLSGLEKPILLYGHNARRFDCPLLVTALTRTDLVSSFCRIVSGFSDTLRAFQSVLPGQKSYKQEDLVRTILNRTYGAHDALEDVRALQDLYRKVASDDVMRQHSFGVADVQQLCRNQVSNRNKMASLAGMIISGVISKYMAEKIASAGLSRDDLVSRYDVSGEEGVLQLLSAKVNGKPRVTKHEKTLRSIVAYLEENAKETKQ